MNLWALDLNVILKKERNVVRKNRFTAYYARYIIPNKIPFRKIQKKFLTNNICDSGPEHYKISKNQNF